MKTRRTFLTVAATAVAAFGLLGPQPAAAADKLTVGLPGIPPIFGVLPAYVAKDTGLFKKYDVNVTLRPFGSGGAAYRALVAGDIDLAFGPTPLNVRMVSNAGVSMTGVWGMENPDWLIGSMDPNKIACGDIKGQGVGVDSIGGARHIQLRQLMRKCKFKKGDVKLVSLSTNVGAAMVAGQITYGVLHLDDIPVIERESGKKVTIVANIREISPGNHYAMLTASKKSLGGKRDAIVRYLAAISDALDMMKDPANHAKIAKMAAPTGRSAADAERALKQYLAMDFWPLSGDGLNAKKIGKVIKIQTRVGGIKKGKTPATVAQLTDGTLFAEAQKMRK